MTARQFISIALRLAVFLGLIALVRPPQTLVTLGEQKTVITRNDLAGVHTRFIEEAEAWKIQRGLSMIREMGAPWIVEFFPWAYLEPRQGQYQWESADRIVDHANRQGLRVIARLGLVPAWARPDSRVQETTFTYLDRSHFTDFAQFAAAFAAHVKGRVGILIIWNEPNLTGEWGLRPVDPAGYVQLLQAAYGPIKRANPDVLVLAGALAPTLEPAGSAQGMNDLIYLERMYAALGHAAVGAGSAPGDSQPGGRPYDGWSVHSYGRTAPPEEAPRPDVINFRRTELLHDSMVQHADGDLPIFITEAGWNDDKYWDYGVTAAKRVQYTLGAWDYARANWPWVRCVAMWVFKLPASAHGYRDHFSFVTPSLEPLPIYDEVKRALNP